MSIRNFSVVALLVVLPVVVEAQRGGGGGGRGFRAGGSAREADAMIRDMAESPSLSKDLQKANPIEAILDKKKDLKLTSDEEKELKALNGELKDAIKPFLKTIDSVSREMKKTGDFAPTSGQMLIGRRLTRESTDSVMHMYRGASEQAIEKLGDERKQPATELLQKEREAAMAARRGGRPPA